MKNYILLIIAALITSTMYCQLQDVVTFTYDAVGNRVRRNPCTQELMKQQNLEGFLYESEACGSLPVTGDTIVLQTTTGTIVSQVPFLITDADGKFVLQTVYINKLDSLQRYRIVTKNADEIRDTSSRTIREWLQMSPITLVLKNCTEDLVAQNSDGLANQNKTATGLEDNNSIISPNNISVYPNPSTGVVIIENDYNTQSNANKQPDKVVFELYDLRGQLIFSKQLTNAINSFDLIANGITTGTYYYVIAVNNAKTQQSKIVLVNK